MTPESMLKVPEEILNDHNDLAAVRGFIGKTYLFRVKTTAQKETLLRGVFQAITEGGSTIDTIRETEASRIFG